MRCWHGVGQALPVPRALSGKALEKSVIYVVERPFQRVCLNTCRSQPPKRLQRTMLSPPSPDQVAIISALGLGQGFLAMQQDSGASMAWRTHGSWLGSQK